MNKLIYQAVLQNKKNEKAKEIKGDWTLRVGREDGTGRDPEVGFHFLWVFFKQCYFLLMSNLLLHKLFDSWSVLYRWLELLPPSLLHDLLQVKFLKQILYSPFRCLKFGRNVIVIFQSAPFPLILATNKNLCIFLELSEYEIFKKKERQDDKLCPMSCCQFQVGLEALQDARNRDLLLCLVRIFLWPS